MIQEEVLPTLFKGIYNRYKSKVEDEEFHFFVAQDIVTALWDIDRALEDQPAMLGRFHALQGDMIDTASFFISQDPARLNGEARIFTNKINKLLMEVQQ